ncbi:MAG: family 16 glycosylhydrolase [Deltaproteobacteria bacterium]|nr:family 16 glycosylhydrolase [Deltaproteobacteria bacterium]
MKYTIYISFLFCFQITYNGYGQSCPVSVDPSNVQTKSPCYTGSWVLEFEDNFTGGVLDTAEWRPLYHYGHKNELAYMTPNNHNFVNYSSNTVNSAYGVLLLVSKAESFGGLNFSSGLIESKGLFGYGKYEIRCKIPSGKGHWPAFWIYGNNTPWQEVDFFEFNFGSGQDENDKVHTSIHYYSPTASRGKETCSDDWSNGTDYLDSFHTFTTIYGPSQTDWFVDGVLIKTMVRWYNVLNQAIPCQSLKVPQIYYHNLAFPKGDPSNISVNSTIGNVNADLPNVFEIDYIGFWVKQPTSTPCDNNVLQMTPFDGSHKGNNAVLFDNARVVDGTSAEVVAREGIDILQNFEVEIGAEFTARIDPYICGSTARIGAPAAENMENSISNQKRGVVNEDDLVIDHQLIQIYPNPTNGQFNVKINNVNEKVALELVDLFGEIIFKETNNKNNLTFNLLGYPKGMYLFKTTIYAELSVQKIIYQ